MKRLDFLGTEEYLESEIALRKQLEKYGRIRWDSDEIFMASAYAKLIDIFGKNISDDSKGKLLETMVRNSGFSEDFVYRKAKPPVTLWKNGRNEVSACIYPCQCDNGTYIHEGVHFLANYGPKRKRIIKQDVPLANILGSFIRLQENPLSELEFLTGLHFENGIDDHPFVKLEPENDIMNPFVFEFVEHSEPEITEASLISVAAYQISLKHGEEIAIKFIKEFYQQGIKANNIKKRYGDYSYEQYIFSLDKENRKWSSMLN
jgi:hypothetical protein